MRSSRTKPRLKSSPCKSKITIHKKKTSYGYLNRKLWRKLRTSYFSILNRGQVWRSWYSPSFSYIKSECSNRTQITEFRKVNTIDIRIQKRIRVQRKIITTCKNDVTRNKFIDWKPHRPFVWRTRPVCCSEPTMVLSESSSLRWGVSISHPMNGTGAIRYSFDVVYSQANVPSLTRPTWSVSLCRRCVLWAFCLI